MRSARSTRASSRRQAVAHVEDGSEKDDTKYGTTRRGANKDGDDASSPISIHDGARSDQEPIPSDTKRKPARSQTSSPMSSQNGDASDQELLSPPKSSSRKCDKDEAPDKTNTNTNTYPSTCTDNVPDTSPNTTVYIYRIWNTAYRLPHKEPGTWYQTTLGSYRYLCTAIYRYWYHQGVVILAL